MRILTMLVHSWHICGDIVKKQGNGCRFFYWFDYIFARFIHGCDSRQYVIGDFFKKSECERFNTYTVFRSKKAFNHLNKKAFRHYLDNKADFNKYFAKWIKREWLEVNKVTCDTLRNFIIKHRIVIVKAIDGMQGVGIYKYEFVGDEDWKALYVKMCIENVIVEEFVKQHEKMNFGGKTVNTVRVMSILDNKGKCSVLKTVMRVSAGNAVVDNYHAGGCIYSVDKETGIVDSRGRSRYATGILFHPNTSIVMLGYQLPNWDSLLTAVKEAHELIPQCRSIGWDVAITKDGIELIEGNYDHDYELYEIVGDTGYWKEIKKFW